MLISSSFTSTAVWHTDQINKVTDFATQVSPAPLRTQNHAGARNETAANEPHRAAAGASHIDHKSDREESKATPRPESRPESRRVHGKSGHRRTHGAAQQTDTESSKPASSAMPAASEVEVPHFLDILSTILPQDLKTNPDQADQTSLRPPESSGAPEAAATPNPNLQINSGVLPEKLEPAKTNFRLTAETASAELTAAPSKSEVAVPQDSSLEVTKQLTSADMKPAVNEKPIERAEMAFAVRVSERTAVPSTLNLNDVHAAIAASRFDASGAGSDSENREHAEPRAAQPIQKGAQTSSAADATNDQPAVPTAPTSSDAPAPQLAGAQDLQTRPSGASPNTRTGGTISAAVAATASLSAGGTQQPAAGMNVSGTLAGGTPESRSPGTDKPAPEGRTLQFFGPEDEKASGASASVRDISLKLTSKDQSPVQVRLSERAGELHVSVRTPDAGLTRGLRDGLSDLVGHLEHHGYRAESWQPTGNGSSNAHDQAQDSPSHNNSSRQQNAGGSGSGSRQQQNARDHQEPETQTPKWVGELESSLQRSLRSWPPSATR